MVQKFTQGWPKFVYQFLKMIDKRLKLEKNPNFEAGFLWVILFSELVFWIFTEMGNHYMQL